MTSHCPNSCFKTAKAAKNNSLSFFLSLSSTFILLLCHSLIIFSFRYFPAVFTKKAKNLLSRSLSLFLYLTRSFLAFTSLHPDATLSLCSCRLCQQQCLQTLIDDGCRRLPLCPAFCFYPNTPFLSLSSPNFFNFSFNC